MTPPPYLLAARFALNLVGISVVIGGSTLAVAWLVGAIR